MRRDLLKKMSVVTMLLVLTFTGCSATEPGSITPARDGEISADTPDEDVVEETGVYYPVLDTSLVGEGVPANGDYAHSYLLYDSGIYVSAGYYIYDAYDLSYDMPDDLIDDISLDDILGDEIGTIYTNKYVYFSQDAEDLNVSTGECTLYKIQGYDEAYRVGVTFTSTNTSGTYEELYIFDKTNGLYLLEGDDFFCKCLKLDDAEKLTITESVSETSGDAEYTLQKEFSSAEIVELLEEWNSAEFIVDEDIEIEDEGKRYTLDFEFANGLTTTLTLKGNYITYLVTEDVVARVDTDMDKLMEGATTITPETDAGTDAGEDDVYISDLVESEQLVSTEVLYDEFTIGSTGDTAQIVLESYDGGGQILKVVSNDEVLGEVYMHTSHSGNKDVYLSFLDGDTCIFVYTPYTMQGDVSLSYEVLSYYSGEEQVVDSDEMDFSYSLYTEADIPVDEVCAFADMVSAYLEGAQLLVSVSTDGVVTAEEIDNDGYTEFVKVLPIVSEDVYDSLGLDEIDSLEEKLELIDKYYKEDFAERYEGQ